MIKIVAIIPTFNRKDKLRIIINQLLQQHLPENISLKVVVVVDGSFDGTLEMLRDDYPVIHFIEGIGNWWYTKSMNEGFNYAKKLNPDFFLTMNDDIEINRNYLECLISDFLIQGKKNLILGSLSVTNDKEGLVHFAGSEKNGKNALSMRPYFPSLALKYDKSFTGVHPSHELAGRGILIPSVLLKELGYFDEGLPQYGSDTDFCFRARRDGCDIMISWNAVVKVNMALTRIRTDSRENSVFIFIKDLFDKHSHSSIRKFILIEYRYGNIFSLLWKIPHYIGASLWRIMMPKIK